MLDPKKIYTIPHPETGELVEWSGDKIRSYATVRGNKIVTEAEAETKAETPAEEPVKKKTTRKRKAAKKADNSEN